jgi:hypothetical protein
MSPGKVSAKVSPPHSVTGALVGHEVQSQQWPSGAAARSWSTRLSVMFLCQKHALTTAGSSQEGYMTTNLMIMTAVQKALTIHQDCVGQVPYIRQSVLSSW